MTVTFSTGDMFDNVWPTVLVDPVNVEGISGGGLAWEIKQRFPRAEAWYQDICHNCNIKPGTLMYHRASGILFFPTKGLLRYPSRIEYIVDGLEAFRQSYVKWGIKKIAFPALGCGLGGLDWNVVEPIMENFLEPLEVEAIIYAPK